MWIYCRASFQEWHVPKQTFHKSLFYWPFFSSVMESSPGASGYVCFFMAVIKLSFIVEGSEHIFILCCKLVMNIPPAVGVLRRFRSTDMTSQLTWRWGKNVKTHLLSSVMRQLSVNVFFPNESASLPAQISLYLHTNRNIYRTDAPFKPRGKDNN